ncbi:hypothetical protein ACFU98_44345 [Streptomyces sp. NPDC057575]|uniref:hypothetical protein n=1 Tax=unclassified Streptomyces TaxID=2593676 RepID=UPI003685C003
MSAARTTPPPPDMGGLSDDWKKLQDLRRGDRLPPEAPSQEHPDDGQEPERPTARRKPTPGRTRGGRRPPPAAADAVPTTIRFDPEEASAIDFFVLELRDDAHRRSLDKAEVFRELIRLAQEHEPTKRALLRRLR